MSGPVEGEGVHLPEPELLLMRPPPVPARLRLLSPPPVFTPTFSFLTSPGNLRAVMPTCLWQQLCPPRARRRTRGPASLCSHEVHLLCSPWARACSSQGSVSSREGWESCSLVSAQLLAGLQGCPSPEGPGWAAAGAAGGCQLRLHCSREPGPGECPASAAPPGPARPPHPIVPAPPREVSGGMSRLLPPLPFPLVLWGRGCAA